MSFLVGLWRSPASHAGNADKSFVRNPIAAIVVAFTLIVNLDRGKPRGIASTRATGHDD